MFTRGFVYALIAVAIVVACFMITSCGSADPPYDPTVICYDRHCYFDSKQTCVECYIPNP